MLLAMAIHAAVAEGEEDVLLRLLRIVRSLLSVVRCHRARMMEAWDGGMVGIESKAAVRLTAKSPKAKTSNCELGEKQ